MRIKTLFDTSIGRLNANEIIIHNKALIIGPGSNHALGNELSHNHEVSGLDLVITGESEYTIIQGNALLINHEQLSNEYDTIIMQQLCNNNDGTIPEQLPLADYDNVYVELCNNPGHYDEGYKGMLMSALRIAYQLSGTHQVSLRVDENNNLIIIKAVRGEQTIEEVIRREAQNRISMPSTITRGGYEIMNNDYIRAIEHEKARIREQISNQTMRTLIEQALQQASITQNTSSGGTALSTLLNRPLSY